MVRDFFLNTEFHPILLQILKEVIKRFLQKIFNPTILRLSKKFSSKPVRDRIFFSLDTLMEKIRKNIGKRGAVLSLTDHPRIIIFSDQHRGAKNLADDFRLAEPNYLASLEWYLKNDYTLISLGDSEEFWENTVIQVKKHNQKSFNLERQFHERQKFFKVFGNHDLYWDNDPLAAFHLNDLYGSNVKIYEAVLLRQQLENMSAEVLLTHGHQGDKSSDGNWFSKWFVSMIWAPLQSFLEINPNTPAFNTEHKCLHNQMMYEWIAEKHNLMLITGHTHQPVFQSLTYIERLYLKLEIARENNDHALQKEIESLLSTQLRKGETIPTYKAFKPSYFNTGCCCYSDGDITGIEIVEGSIKLVKWRFNTNLKSSERIVLEQAQLDVCFSTP